MAAAGVPQFASLYVGDLHPDVTEAMLYEIFNSVGPVASIRVCRDSITRRSLGYGYVNFHGVSDAERALDTLNYSSIKGRSCRIMWSQRDPSLRKSGAGNIYVKNLDRNIDNKALYDTFSLFGNILSCKVAADAHGKSYGYGFVHYETEEAAKQAIQRVNGMQIGEKTVQVCQFIKRGDRDKPDITNYTNLYVKNFVDWDEAKLLEVFNEFGPVTSSVLRMDNKNRMFAFVGYEESAHARAAVEALHGKEMRTEEQIAKDKEEGKEEVEGHPPYQLYVQRAQSKYERAQELKEKFAGPSGNESKQQGVNLYVKNLDDKTDDAALRALFEPFGTITSVATPKDDKGNCKGFGFVCFASPDEATKAVTEMHLRVVKGKPLYVGLAEKREARQERLRQRYSPEAMKGGAKGGKGGKGGPGGMQTQMYGQGGMGGMMPPNMGYPGMQGMMRPPMMGMMPPQMMSMMGKGGPMMGGMGGMGGMAGMGGMGGMGPRGPMMGNPQMMGMMGKGGANMGGAPGGKGAQGGMMGMQPGMGMMRPQQMQGMARPQAQQTAAPTGGAGLSAAALAAAPATVQKQMIGEKLFPAISKIQPELAGKITGMMLEMDNSELLILLESEQQLKNKVDEALRVLETSK
eukprot:CAMPEP_0170595252 /NCGR_PEP_ID=MMETSP0224-20130122/14457_1 /TAXON_ID=285029 /ORGANISM="Togula jolla, Strain CCCM 725" /LENGTH=630 /DNA_ID=CAMNT_0010919409 /DNA_START=125 /DNA_END=2017 /DNA_ORIENTATION=-